MKIVADENIVAVQQHYTKHGELALLPGRSIRPEDVRDADALLVRSITQVDRKLLEGSRVSFVATATSGTDHLDLDYLASAGIAVADAAGSNANAVVEYCLAGMAELICTRQFTLHNKTVAIVGFGHVGSRLYKRLRELDVTCIVCDPFVEEQSRVDRGRHEELRHVSFCDLATALAAQVITLHVPLTRASSHPTFHLLDEARLAQLASGTLLINASRGEVVDNQALLRRLSDRNDLLTLFDVWENEPDINQDLLGLVSLGTPHIAGYSVEAKKSASRMSYNAFLRHFGLQVGFELGIEELVRRRVDVVLTRENSISDERCWAECVRAAFRVPDIDRRLRVPANGQSAALFDAIRKSLAERREFSNYAFDQQLLDGGYVSERVANQLTQLGFTFRGSEPARE
ncbi:MAG: hypothetical protein A3H44_04570 [Gammaproteobacteria bacterium RIFCSPLOWO2_02_FULL_57_10]|nr:MAG: hypothetical protein A3H44_04570 [Gammaproteobacteria bacterium RIFCSPLOWO2_02_FULL_57_10]